MPRIKKEQEPLNVRLDKSIAERLVEYCGEVGQTKTTAVERALTMLIDDYERKKDIINRNTK